VSTTLPPSIAAVSQPSATATTPVRVVSSGAGGAGGLRGQGVGIGLDTAEGRRTLLRATDFSVDAGELLVVMGPSGAGKSALLNWLAGLLEPPLTGRGRLWLDSEEITHWPVERRRVGLLFQDDLLFPHLNVLDNLLFAVPRGARRQRIDTALAALGHAGLDGLQSRLPAQLSGGQRSRVSLLRALLARPRALLLDEPYARLDAPLRAQMRSLVLDSVRAAGIPGVLVTHDDADVPPGAQVLRLEPVG